MSFPGLKLPVDRSRFILRPTWVPLLVTETRMVMAYPLQETAAPPLRFTGMPGLSMCLSPQSLKIHMDTWSLHLSRSPWPLKTHRDTGSLNFGPLPLRVMGSVPSMLTHSSLGCRLQNSSGYNTQTSFFTTIPRLGLYIHYIIHLKGRLTAFRMLVLFRVLQNSMSSRGKGKRSFMSLLVLSLLHALPVCFLQPIPWPPCSQ